MKRIFLLTAFVLMSCAPTRYIPKDSEPLSRAVYATSDSIDKGRIDLADQYSKTVITLVVPPKERIEIQPLVSKSKSNPTEKSKNILVIPKHLQGMEVIVVDSIEYQKLLEIKENVVQIQKEVIDLKNQKKEVEDQLRDQTEAKSQLLKDYDNLVLELKDKQLTLLKRNITIAGLFLLIGLYIFFKVKKILPIPF